MIRKFLCFIGWHDWYSYYMADDENGNSTFGPFEDTYTFCRHCGIRH